MEANLLHADARFRQLAGHVQPHAWKMARAAEFLDLALSSYQDDEHAFVPVRTVQKWIWWWPEYFQDPDFHARLHKVKEFRLMADNQYCFAEEDVLLALGIFPNLKKLGLAHMLLGVGRWGSVAR
jgi:hypothetical protein